ncbi:MAG: hypothetical protein ISR65_02835 [Bacteriovoracaceae bacterium]|nr:hypothetical protein [Bacteriovoracaceae bacterium]
MYNINPRERKIINTLGKWRVLHFQELHKEVDKNIHRTTFGKIVAKLEEREIVKSFFDGHYKKKLLFLSNKGIKLVGNKQIESLDYSTIAHEVATSRVTREMLKLTKVHDAYFSHEINDPSELNKANAIDPDAILYCTAKTQKIVVGLEIELTQKYRQRVTSKFKNYNESDYYDLALYGFEDKKIYHAYNRFLVGLKDDLKPDVWSDLRKTIMFFYHPNLQVIADTIVDSECCYDGNVKKLGNYFDF